MCQGERADQCRQTCLERRSRAYRARTSYAHFMVRPRGMTIAPRSVVGAPLSEADNPTERKAIVSLALSRSRSRPQRKDVVNSEPAEAASPQLRYVSDARPGIRRLRRGTGFRYLDTEGHRVRDLATLRRIKTLAIPPEGVAEVARHLGNTVAICRKCYIHPAVIVAHAEDALPGVLARSSPETSSNLSRVEAAVLRLLEARS
jgi:hypothetical protein